MPAKCCYQNEIGALQIVGDFLCEGAMLAARKIVVENVRHGDNRSWPIKNVAQIQDLIAGPAVDIFICRNKK